MGQWPRRDTCSRTWFQERGMSTRTPAVADDFPHFAAWYGRTPTFDYARIRAKDFNCRDQLFKIRQLIDGRTYGNWQYSDAESYGSSAYFQAIEDWMRCRRIGKLDPPERPQKLREWFEETNKVNHMWTYRQPPNEIGKHEI